MATAAEKRDEVKAKLQELRNMCREIHQVVTDEGTLPEPGEVRTVNSKLQDLLDYLDPKNSNK